MVVADRRLPAELYWSAVRTVVDPRAAAAHVRSGGGRVFQERARSYDFWIDNGLALVGSPDTVIRKIQEQHALIGHDVLCTQHGFGHLAPELVKKSITLFGEEVIPAFA